MNELKVGDSRRVFEVTQKLAERFRVPSLYGRWFAEGDDYLDCEYGVNAPIPLEGLTYLHVGIDERAEARCVGRLTITKLK